MSVIAYYMRIDTDQIDSAAANFDAVLEGRFDAGGCEVINIDKAYEPLAWLASPLSRAEAAHNDRAMFDDDWPDEEARESVKKLEELALDDLLVAIEGRSTVRTDKISFGLGDSALFSPERVEELNRAIGALSEAVLRQQLDFELMEELDVQPGYWLEEGEEGGEDTFQTYVLIGLKRLQDFYMAAAVGNQAVLIGYS
jgi:hypothetical protein